MDGICPNTGEQCPKIQVIADVCRQATNDLPEGLPPTPISKLSLQQWSAWVAYLSMGPQVLKLRRRVEETGCVGKCALVDIDVTRYIRG